MLKTRCVNLLLFLLLNLYAGAPNIFAQAHEEQPVRISFDRQSERIDIKSGKQLPNYTKAQRGSIRFYQGRLDTPEEGFLYYIDGRRFQPVNRTVFMRKLPQLGTWVVVGLNRWSTENLMESEEILSTHPKMNTEILHHAVSFIPLNPETGEPEARVYVLVDDLELIQWREYGHWLAEVSQEELISMKNNIY